jgi:hypothetical protein
VSQLQNNDQSAAMQVLVEKLSMGIVSPYKELTLKEAHFITGISPDIMRRRWRLDEDWSDVIYTVGAAKAELRTTLDLIHKCQQRSAQRARIVANTKQTRKKQV